jgi:hypothetical protein
MTSRALKSAIWLAMVGSLTAIAAGGVAYAKGKPPTEATNNLSVPAIMVAGTAGNLTSCTGSDWSDLVEPMGDPLSGYTIDMSAYYFVQKMHRWQAQCRMAGIDESISVFGAWGDNLTGDAKLKAGSPIRVELVLTEADGARALGYNVVKLEPEKLDRLSAYGTLATEDGAGAYAATAEVMTPVVHDGRANLRISAVDPANDFELFIDPIAPEINATGKVVYGYNLRVPAAGAYDITFTMPSVTFTDCDLPNTCADHTATLRINVVGGGGNRPPRP